MRGSDSMDGVPAEMDIQLLRSKIGALEQLLEGYEKTTVEQTDKLYREIAERKAAEQELEKYRVHLEELVKERTGELIKAVESLNSEIIDRKRIETELRESEERYRRLFETSKDGILLLNKNTGNIINVNPAAEELLGYSREELSEKSIKDIIKHAADFQKIMRKLNESGFIFYEDVLVEAKGGHYIDTDIYIINRAKMLQCNIRDITGRKTAEEELKKSAAEINDLYNNAPCGYQSLNKDGIFVHINDTELSWLGYSREEIIGNKKFSDIITEESQKVFQENFTLLKERGWLQDIEVGMIRKNGSVMNVLLSATVLKDKAGNFVMSRATLYDITERKHAEEALRESERFLETIIENAPVCVKLLAADGILIRMNRAGLDMIGADSPDQVNGKSIYPIVSPGYREDLKNLTDEVFRGKSRTLEFEITGFKGERRLLDTRAVPLYNDKKEIIALLGITLDITERKRVEEALSESKERISAILESSMDAIIMVDEDGIVSYFNPSAENMFGYKHSEAIGKSLHALIVSEEAREKYSQTLPNFQSTGQCKIVGKPIEVNAIRKDGARFPVEISIVSMQIKGKWHAAGTIRDITGRRRAEEERKRLEQQLLQSQKMEAIGQLAGGIAHDFNNILTAIISYANLVQMTVPADDPSKAYVENVLALSNRAATLTQGLLAFSRKQILDQRPVDMNEIIIRVEKLLSRIIGEDIVFRTDLVDGPLIVFADMGQMEQVLMNLAANARDAMPRGGVLNISTLRIILDEEFVKMHGYGKSGSYVIVSVSDTGTGMDEETRQRIFDPFFTTKELGRGTGLGLSIVYGIIKQHNGYVDVYSEMGKGTTFKFYLPLIGTEAGEAAKAGVAVTPRGNETILLAEDEPEVRNSTKIILESYGYKVIEASDGEEAVRKFGENKDAVQILLIDVVMPKKNGREVYEDIIKTRPDVKAIFVSGYTADIMYKKEFLEKGLAFVSKPIAPTDLLRKIREQLDNE
jgi:PAS domain S-box-containing protein